MVGCGQVSPLADPAAEAARASGSFDAPVCGPIHVSASVSSLHAYLRVLHALRGLAMWFVVSALSPCVAHAHCARTTLLLPFVGTLHARGHVRVDCTGVGVRVLYARCTVCRLRGCCRTTGLWSSTWRPPQAVAPSQWRSLAWWCLHRAGPLRWGVPKPARTAPAPSQPLARCLLVQPCSSGATARHACLPFTCARTEGVRLGKRCCCLTHHCLCMGNGDTY
jgi:hypothetical protein